MPSASKRNYNTRPVSMDVYERHNRHTRETWHDVQAARSREQRRVKPSGSINRYLEPEIYEEV